MFFDKLSDIKRISQNVGTSIFVVPDDREVELKSSLVLQPEGKNVITIEQVRELIGRISTRQLDDVFVVIRPAEQLGEEAANALLKHLEEPGDRVHFVLVTNKLSQILPTILSRAVIYFLRTEWRVDGAIMASDKDKTLAKRLMTAKASELVDVAEEIAKKKDGVRAYAMGILGIAIEMTYKTYLMTGKDAFLVKIPKFLQAYDGISKNGNVKLQIVSNLC